MESTLLPDILSYNLVSEIMGSEFPGDIMTVGGHPDSWHLAEGAPDYGAGCVHAIEVLSVLKSTGIQPKHAKRAVMFGMKKMASLIYLVDKYGL
ncbi:MAG: M28 family peptidase [Ferruginibacter sp.]